MKGLAKEHICITLRHKQQCGDSKRERGWGQVEVGKGGDMGTERDFARGDDAVCRWWFIDLYTWNLYGFAHQCHPNKLN